MFTTSVVQKFLGFFPRIFCKHKIGVSGDMIILIVLCPLVQHSARLVIFTITVRERNLAILNVVSPTGFSAMMLGSPITVTRRPVLRA